MITITTLKMMMVLKEMVHKISDCGDTGVGNERREHKHINLFEKKMRAIFCVVDSTV